MSTGNRGSNVVTIVHRHSRRRAVVLLVLLLAACALGIAVAQYGSGWARQMPISWLTALFVLMLAFPLLLLGSLAAHRFILAHKAQARAKASLAWPTANGTVLVSEIEAMYTPKSMIYTPIVRYEYTVGGRRYESDVIAFGLTAQTSQKKAEAAIAGRTAGAAVTVHYDPDDPAKATLDTTSHEASKLRRTGWIMIGIAIAIYGFMGYGFLR
jgi:hypothetical protein